MPVARISRRVRSTEPSVNVTAKPASTADAAVTAPSRTSTEG